MRPRRATGALVFSLAAALAVLAATSARADEPTSSRVVAPVETTPAVPPLAGAEGAGWMTAPAPTLADDSPAAPAPLASRWWFWASLGVAAVAVVVAGFTFKPGQPYAGNSGIVSLP